jgi:phytoene dehydrogenase-like protein
MFMDESKIVIIGGGVAGLVAACRLARAGKRVTVLEKAERFGGRAITVTKNGALLNLGSHAFYRGGEAERIFRELGLRLAGGSPSIAISVLWDGRVMPLARFIMGRPFTWAGRIELARALLKLMRPDPAAEDISDASLRAWIERHLREPMGRNLLYAMLRTSTFTHAPDRQCAGPALKQARRTLKPGAVVYLEGGWQSIVDQLVGIALREGAELVRSAGVEAVMHEDGRVRGVRLKDGSELEAEAVIAAVPPAEACRLVRSAEQTSLRVWKEQARPVTVACLDLCLRRLPAPRNRIVMGIDEPVFFSYQSGPTPSLAKEGHVVHAVRYHGIGEHDPAGDEAALEQAMDVIQPGWRDEMIARQYLPAMTAAYDYPHAGRADRAPGPAVPEVRGLYVAGEWTGRGELLVDAAAASGERAAEKLLDDLRTVGDRPHHGTEAGRCASAENFFSQ